MGNQHHAKASKKGDRAEEPTAAQIKQALRSIGSVKRTTELSGPDAPRFSRFTRDLLKKIAEEKRRTE